MYKKFYQHFLKANPDKLHFAAHSHHYWPDVTREAQLKYWDDTAKLVDGKWNVLFGQEVPKAQKYISDILNFSRPDDIAFAPNIHIFINRLYSCLPVNKPKRILTTDSEFHSFERQMNRYAEDKELTLDKIKCGDEENFEKFMSEAKRLLTENFYEMVYLSSGLFNSGMQIRPEHIKELLDLTSPNTLFVIDGYHTFTAVPFDLSSIEDRVFFMSGSYKYAQGGEGLCFMTLPKDCELRPRDTGWFAHFEGLEEGVTKKVGYSKGGLRFWGATVDLTPLYRFNATWDLFAKENITVDNIHSYVSKLRDSAQSFLEDKVNGHLIKGQGEHGHFLTFDLGEHQKCSEFYDDLISRDIITDFRGSRLRFGFGMYHDQNDLNELYSRL